MKRRADLTEKLFDCARQFLAGSFPLTMGAVILG